MNGEESIFELSDDEILKRKIAYLQKRIKEMKLEIKRSEALLASRDGNVITLEPIVGEALTLFEVNFTAKHWKPRVYGFLFDNQTEFTTAEILKALDNENLYQSDAYRSKAIKAISLALHQLNSEKKVDKFENPGKHGHKWKVKETGSNQMTEPVKILRDLTSHIRT